MRKISFFAGVVAVLVLVGVGNWIGVGKGTSTSALAGSAVNPSAMMTSATDRTMMTTRWCSLSYKVSGSP